MKRSTMLPGGACISAAQRLAAAILAFLLLAHPTTAVHWFLDYGRQECVDAWVPKDQWNLIMHSVAAAGDLSSVDVKTAEMEVQLETGVLVYTADRAQLPAAAVDLIIKDPLGTVLATQYHTNEDERTIQSRGKRGPWQLCMTVSKTGKWYKMLLAQVTHFNVNHLQLVGTNAEGPKTTMPNITSARHGNNITTFGPSSDVASEAHAAFAKQALQNVAIWLAGAEWQVQHRRAITESQLLAAQRQAAHLMGWMAAINAAVISICMSQVLAIRFMLRHATSEVTATTGGISNTNSPLFVHHRQAMPRPRLNQLHLAGGGDL